MVVNAFEPDIIIINKHTQNIEIYNVHKMLTTCNITML